MKFRHVTGVRALGLVLGLLILPGSAFAQVFVYPRRPNKSQVRYFDFTWQHVDLMVGPEADTKEADLGRKVGDKTPRVPGTDQQHVPGEDTPSTPSPRGGPATPQPSPGSGGPQEGGPDEGGGVGFPVEDAGVPLSAARGATDGGVASAPDAGLLPVTALGEPAFAERTLPPLGDPKKLLGAKTGGVRLFFYERERQVSERAAALIMRAYTYLVGQFDYVPTQTFPYVLYSSYQEFLQTNLFPLQEGVLGVTSPVDLKLTLPYFGDDQLFAEVSAHEMAHQFTIQKVRSVTEQAKIWGDPLGAMPLWFIEGLAEYYAKQGIDPEAEMLVRDIVVNPDVELGYVLLDFYEDRPWSVLWTYKMGQVRVAFLEETYGKGITQRILVESPRLAGEVKSQPAIRDFQTLLGMLTGDDPKKIAVKFEAWLKHRAFRTYLSASQGTPALEPLENFKSLFVDSMTASPSGNLLAIRSMDEVTGRSRLAILDWRAPEHDKVVAVDGVPGTESLHPIFGRNFDLRDDAICYVAESGGSDVIFVKGIRHAAEKVSVEEVQKEQLHPETGMPEVAPRPQQTEAWNVDLKLENRAAFDVRRKQLIAAYAPSFSPDGKRIAFIGFDTTGTRDLYVLDPDAKDPDGFRLTRLTNDAYAERQLAWGKDGIVFTSEATGHGRYNLFRVRPEAPDKVERLTTEARDHQDPMVLPDGRVVFTAYDRGRADVHEVRDGSIVRRTDITTGLFDLSPGPNGGLWALYHQGGRRRPVRVVDSRLLTLETLPQPPPVAAHPRPARSLAASEHYKPFALRNWELGPPFGYVGAGSGGIIGQLVASAADKLRNHALLLNVAVLGSFELTDGYLVYVNQERRVSWGAGLFQSLMFREDLTFDNFRFSSAERFYGVLGSARYPFNQFVYMQADLQVGGVTYFLSPTYEHLLADPALNPLRRNVVGEWLRLHEGPRFQTEGTLRWGYDTIRYGGGTGPLAGNSILLEGSTAWQPFAQQMFGTARLDAEQYFPLIGTSNIFFRVGTGVTFGGRLARQFYLSSFDTLRGIPFGATDWLIGSNFLFSTAELQIPLNSVIRVLILNNIEAIAGVDFGGVGQDVRGVWDRRVFAPVVGANFGLGPLVIRLHFARPIDIGAPAGLPVKEGDWVTNFSIVILGFEGLGDRRMGSANAPTRVRPTTLMNEPRTPFY